VQHLYPASCGGCIGSLDMLGVKGSIIADELARGGPALRFVGLEPALGVSRQNIRRRIKRWLVTRHWA
jgi:hypothetical protein